MKFFTAASLFVGLGGVWAAPGYFRVKPRDEAFGAGCKSISLENDDVNRGPYLIADCSANNTLIISELNLNHCIANRNGSIVVGTNSRNISDACNSFIYDTHGIMGAVCPDDAGKNVTIRYELAEVIRFEENMLHCGPFGPDKQFRRNFNFTIIGKH
ncbi:hypothetical protein F5Y14DRAFT_455838 [Nemania sp. NC0429]|nr:hypothetical protein F5Y14DRAFT_455838 [Nemania sp. NC0429]